MTYKYRHRGEYKGCVLDIKAMSKSELKRKLEEKKLSIDKFNKNTSFEQRLFNEWADEWLSVYKAHSSASCISNIRTFIKKYNEYFYNKSLDGIKMLDIQKFFNDLHKYSPSYIKKARLYLYDIFEKGKINALCAFNPVYGVSLPKMKEQGRRRALTVQERVLIQEVAKNHRYGAWVMVLYHLGIRPSESVRILVEHIDLKKRQIYIDGTKTATAKRTLPIPNKLIPYLKEAIALVNTKYQDKRYLFLNKNGRPITKSNRQDWFLQIKKAMHIHLGGETDYKSLQRIVNNRIAQDLTLYCLRHDYCTRLAEAGIRETVAKDLMGHSSTAMVSNVYTHTTETSMSQARDLINEYF